MRGALFSSNRQPEILYHYGQRARPWRVSLKSLPAQLPLGLMLSLLLGYLAWLATANRMSLRGRSIWALRRGNLSQPLVNARTQACTGVRSCCGVVDRFVQLGRLAPRSRDFH